jgi:hypothetical protein
MEPDGPQRDRPVTCIIVQQYSSATFVSMRSHFGKGTFWRGLLAMPRFHFLLLSLIA